MPNVLVIAAHPDDEVLGCGGTMARLADDGHQVHVAILGEGLSSRNRQRELTDPEDIAALHQCSHRAGEVLGVQRVSLHGLPDNRFDTVPLLEVVKEIEDVIAQVRPEVVFTQHGGDLNIDHEVTYRAVLTATRPVPQSCVKVVNAYEVASSSEWAFQSFSPKFCPTLFYDVSDTLERKIEAMKVYQSEMRPYPHPRSPEALRAIAQRWGSTAGCSAAEAFSVVRHIV